MEVFTLYPKLISTVKVEQHEQFKKLLVPALTKQYEQNKNKKLDWARWADTWSMYAYITKDMGFETYVDSWLKYFNYPKVDYEINAWVNVHKWYQFQEEHTHMCDRAFLSGIYYIQLSDKDNPAQFVRDSDYPMIYTNDLLGDVPNHPHFTRYSSDAGLTIEEGDLVLFTPDCRHFVPQAKEKHDGLRMTLSFNAHKL
tara:strand:+ start:82 stop:675 length:594 start_codon:yes stop_codon:yes gene_type:complete